MAQGSIKMKAPASKAAGKPNSAKTKKGARVAKPKNATGSAKVQKKYSSGLANRTEKLLGERAGHLEMIGKGRDRASGAKNEAKGGTKKFG